MSSHKIPSGIEVEVFVAMAEHHGADEIVNVKSSYSAEAWFDSFNNEDAEIAFEEELNAYVKQQEFFESLSEEEAAELCIKF